MCSCTVLLQSAVYKQCIVTLPLMKLYFRGKEFIVCTGTGIFDQHDTFIVHLCKGVATN